MQVNLSWQFMYLIRSDIQWKWKSALFVTQFFISQNSFLLCFSHIEDISTSHIEINLVYKHAVLWFVLNSLAAPNFTKRARELVNIDRFYARGRIIRPGLWMRPRRFYTKDASSVWTNLGRHLLFVRLCVFSIMTATRRIMCLDGLYIDWMHLDRSSSLGVYNNPIFLSRRFHRPLYF